MKATLIIPPSSPTSVARWQASRGKPFALIVVLLLASAPEARGQAPPSQAAHGPTSTMADSAAEAAFLAAAQAGTLRYRDLAAARADGYRPLGGELPSLGEHWVHNRRALANVLDPAAPSILVYVRVAGEPVLAGVAYTRFLAPGAPLPDFPRGRPHAWHEHNGGVEDEVLPLAHHGVSQSAKAGDGSTASTPANAHPSGVVPRLRIAVMHAWIGVANPAGVWVSENWGLPYVRLGLAPHAGPGGLDARVLSLATGKDYYLRAVASVGKLDASETTRVEWILADYAARAASRRPQTDNALHLLSSPTVPAQAASLLWDSLWNEIGASVGPEAAARLAPLRAALSGESR
jgi:hypothetical protein